MVIDRNYLHLSSDAEQHLKRELRAQSHLRLRVDELESTGVLLDVFEHLL
jgi:hypothetical protein